MSIRKGNTIISGSVIVENTLDSENTTTALSAKQGKILNDKAIPSGGAKDQVLVKVSDADYDFAWVDAKISGGGGDTIPVGAIFPYPSHKMPYGYLECNGQTFDKETYPTLGRICDENFGFKWQYMTQWNSYDDRWYSATPFWCNLSALTTGNEYNISIAGKQYKQELKHMTDDPEDIGLVDVYYFGNLYLMDSESEDTGEPFIWECVVPRDSGAPMPPYFNQIVGIEFPSEEYIKLSIDTTKTFMLLNSEESGGGLVTSYFPYFNFFKEDEYYDIKFNNVLYHSKCVSCSGYPMKFIGNMSLFESGWDDTGEPFLLGIQIYDGEVSSTVLYCETTSTDLCIPIEFVIDEHVSFLPDLTGLTIAGYKPEDEVFGTIGGVVGSLYHNHYINGTTLTVDQIPSHSHTTGISGSVAGTMGSGSNSAQVSHDQTKGVQTVATGGGQSHRHSEDSELSLQPTMTLVWIVKAEEMTPVDAIVEDTLGSNSATNALSAKQGKILNQKAIPKGGIMGQVLGKKSDDDNDVRWMDMREGVDYTPIGTISPWGGVEAPVGYAICDGRRINKNEYPEYANGIGKQYFPGVWFTGNITVANHYIEVLPSAWIDGNLLHSGENYNFLIDGEKKTLECKRYIPDSFEEDPFSGWTYFGNLHLIDSEFPNTGEDFVIAYLGYDREWFFCFPTIGIHNVYLPIIQGYMSSGNYMHTIYDVWNYDYLTEWGKYFNVGDSVDIDFYTWNDNLTFAFSIHDTWKEYYIYDDYVVKYIGNLWFYDSSLPNTGEDYVFINNYSYAYDIEYIHYLEGCLASSLSSSDYYLDFKINPLTNSYPYAFVPDLRSKVIGGYNSYDNSYGFGTLNGNAGRTFHSHSTQSHKLTIAEMPAHTHGTTFYNDDFSNGGDSGRTLDEMKASAGLTYDVAYKSGSWVKTSESTGGDQYHSHGSTSNESNIQPTMAMHWIIKIATLSRGDIVNNSKIINVFSPVMEYNVGDIVLYNKTLYRCKKAVTEPGEWTGLDRTVYRNLQVGDSLNGKTLQFNWPTYFSAESMYPIFISVEGSGGPIMGLMPYDESLYVMTTITDFPGGSPVYSDPLIGYTLDDSTDPGEYWVDWSVPQMTEVTYSNNIPGPVAMIAPGFENAFKIAEEGEGNWEIYSDPVVYKLQDENISASFQNALKSESDIYSIVPESLGWSGVEEIITACDAYDGNLYIDAFGHILRVDISAEAGEKTYILTIPDNTQQLFIDDELQSITYNGYLFIVTGSQLGDRSNFQLFKVPFETPKAEQNTIGGIQIYFDTTNNTLYMTNNGHTPGPNGTFTLPSGDNVTFTQGETWKQWIKSGEAEDYGDFDFVLDETIGVSYIMDMSTGQYIGYDGSVVLATDTIVNNRTYEYVERFDMFALSEFNNPENGNLTIKELEVKPLADPYSQETTLDTTSNNSLTKLAGEPVNNLDELAFVTKKEQEVVVDKKPFEFGGIVLTIIMGVVTLGILAGFLYIFKIKKAK